MKSYPILVMLCVLVSVSFGRTTGQESQLLDPDKLSDDMVKGATSDPVTLQSLQTVPLPSGREATFPALSTVSVKDGALSATAVNEIKSYGVILQKSKKVTITSDSIKAESVSSTTQSSFRAKDATEVSIGRDGGMDFASAKTIEDGGSTLTSVQGVRKLGQVLSIRAGESLSSPKLDAQDFTNLILNQNGDFSVSQAQTLDVLDSKEISIRQAQGSLTNSRLTFKSAQSLRSGSFQAQNLKDAKVFLGAKVIIQSNDSLNVIVGKHILNISPYNNSLTLTAVRDPSDDSILTLQSANVTFQDELTEIPTIAQVTSTFKDGLFCLDLEPSSSYRYGKEQSKVFRLTPKVNHRLCIRRSLQQNPGLCTQCTILDLTANQIKSQGNMVYQRFIESFTDFIVPTAPSNYTVAWQDGPSYDLSESSDNITIFITPALSVQDERIATVLHRFLFYTASNITFDPLLNQLRSSFPLWISPNQFSIHNASIRVKL